MRTRLISLPTLLLAGFFQTAANADEIPVIVTAKDLLLPCQEADNDPRDGYLALLECTQFIRGFVLGAEAAGAAPLCAPEANRDDHLRRAFVQWVHKSFARRGMMPVDQALSEALSEVFACE